MIKILTDFNADPNISGGNDNVTPLWLAASSGSLDCVKNLAACCPGTLDYEIPTREERVTPFLAAAANGHIECAMEIVSKVITLNPELQILNPKSQNLTPKTSLTHDQAPKAAHAFTTNLDNGQQLNIFVGA